MPTPPPIPPDERSPFGPEGAPKTFSDVSHRVRHAAERGERNVAPTATWPDIDVGVPLLKLAGAALAGYVLGALIHGRSERSEPRPSGRPRTIPERVAAGRSSVPAEGRPSGIRFR